MNLQQRLLVGAAHMDRLYPGWVQRSDPKKLNMASPYQDVLEQGGIHSFEPGVEPEPQFDQFLKLHGWEGAVDHAFAPDEAAGETYDDLTAAWADYLSLRQETDPKP